MIDEIAAVWQDQALLSDELKIIAGERNGLSAKDRESLRKSATLLEEQAKAYRGMFQSLQERKAQLDAVEERLREANAKLAVTNCFPTLTATGFVFAHRP